jgi:hypothetical protein
MAKKILILTEPFAPPSYLPRIINLCKNLDKNKWDIHIFTEKIIDINYNTDLCTLHQMPYYKSKNKLYWFYMWALHFLFQYKDIKLQKFIEKQININNFDIIFCSISNIFPITTAARLSKKYNKPLIIDLRDIDEQWGNHKYFTHTISNFTTINHFISKKIENKNIKRRNKALIQAKIITTISPWHRDFIKNINPNTELIYNGYDAKIFTPEQIHTNTFNITYTGRLIDLKFRNPNLLFKAIEQLNKEKQISPDTLKIKWYIGNNLKNELIKLIELHNITSYNEILDFVPNNKIPNILNNSSINLILSTKSSDNGPHGIMTTKFFEALGVEKPILCVQSDEECLARVIRETNAGLAATNVEEIKKFILHHYNQWLKHGYTQINIINKEQFSRQKQALQFEELFNKIIK